ncbi:hypothetical protein PTSG_02966 [Salpingoeca rosetta]|uniref:U-box domain-containing protein n=1 Tax=Salpingoeca rosetta (strain ATCC 50818 / BSB-021) TaxID=946362 RepID=F2U3V4_SALR5|nr:uncharacterized protein PTSG_02966 [Salpingoeca rosetta]EGD82298.1 hypothetical protein PTSG_02966 [Salpingoeca rosetta]|eukprot:XP_004996481.1 hypothetical protein PTSG_02966 [Salpingoeca rosetta]
MATPEAEDTRAFTCPITLELMTDPVVASDGNTYERAAIEDWMRRDKRSPLTQEMLRDELTPNRNLRDALEAYIRAAQQQGSQRQGHRGDGDGDQEESGTRTPTPTSSTSPLTAGSAATASRVPLAMTPEQPSSLRTIRPKALALLDRLTDVSSGIDWSPPQIVILGGENHGKSTTMERLLGLPIFPRDRELCTRVPIRVQLRRGVAQAPTITRREVQEGDSTTTPHDQRRTGGGSSAQGTHRPQHFTVQQMLTQVRQHMKDILEQLNAEGAPGDEPHGVSLHHEIVVRLQGPTYPEMDLVDLPGLVETSATEPSMPEHTRKLTSRYLSAHGDHSMFLVVLDACLAMNQARALSLIQEHNLLDSCMGVLTKCDLVRTESDDETVADVINEKLNPANRSHVPMGYGWCLLASRSSPKFDPTAVRGAEYLQTLKTVQVNERKRFESNVDLEGVQPVWGIDYMCRRLCDKYTQYLYEHWTPQAIARLSTKLDALEEDVRALGIPFVKPPSPRQQQQQQQQQQQGEGGSTSGGDGASSGADGGGGGGGGGDDDDDADVSLPCFAPHVDVMGAVELEGSLRAHLQRQLETKCEYHAVCEKWLLRALRPLRMALHVVGGSSNNNSAMFLDSFQSARRRVHERTATLQASLETVAATLQGALDAPYHPVAEELVQTLQSSDVSAWRLQRFTALAQDMKRALAASLSTWTRACVSVVRAAQHWVVHCRQQVPTTQALASTSGSGSDGSQEPVNWFASFLALQDPQVTSMYNAVLSACTTAYDNTAVGLAMPTQIDITDATEKQRYVILVTMKELQSAKHQLEALLATAPQPAA